MKVKKRFGYPPDLEETPLVNFFKLRNNYFEEQDIYGVDMCYADQEPRRARRVDYSAMAKSNFQIVQSSM